MEPVAYGCPDEVIFEIHSKGAEMSLGEAGRQNMYWKT